jgi:hypothetical protein
VIRLSWVALLVAVAVDCGKSAAPGASVRSAGPGGGAEASAEETGGEAGADPMDAREAAQWAAAREGEAEELARLVDLVGCEGVRERGEDAALRTTAIRALEYCTDFTELPWLAQIAASGRDEEARAALDSIVELAARRRTATDPEDAEELHAGCVALLELARATDRPKERRAVSIRALRMLADRGCVRRSEIPTDLDAR